MAKPKVDTNNEYLDSSANDFSNAVRELLVLERDAYDVLKQRKANVLAAVKLEMAVAPGERLSGRLIQRGDNGR